jgi:zona occludens toxin
MPLITGGLVLASLLLVFMVVRTIRSHVDPAPSAAAAASSPATSTSTATKRGTFREVAAGTISSATLAVAFNPRIQDRPETAPAYDELRRVVNMPRVVGGYCIGERCRCINQQNLDAGLSDAACRAWLKSPPFDPYFQREPPQATRSGLGEASSRHAPPSPPVRQEPVPAAPTS